MKNRKTIKMPYALIFCLIGCIGSLSCFLLPKEELDYYVDYYNMDNREQNGSNCRIYFGSIPEIRWKDYTGFTGYQLQVSQDEKFSTLLVDEANLTTASCQLSTPIKTAGSYYYRTKYKTPDNTWSQWSDPVKITLYADTLQDDFEVLPDSETAPIPWVVDGKVKLNTANKKTGASCLELKTDKNQKSISLVTEVYCAGATRFSFWHYYNIIIIIDGTSKNEISYSWESFNTTLTPGYHTIKLKTEDFSGGYFSSFTNSVYLDDLQFNYYGEKADNFFSEIGTVLTGYEFTGTTLPVFKEETGSGVYLEMGQGNSSSDTNLTLTITPAVPCRLSFLYLVNYGFTSEGQFSVSCNSSSYYDNNGGMSSWNALVLPLVAGENSITIRYDKYYDNEAAKAAVRGFKFMSLLDGFENGSLNDPPRSTSGALPVAIQSTYKTEGLKAVSIGDSNQSAKGSGTLQLALTVTEEAVISFDFMIGSSTSDDFVFYIDNTQIKKWDYISSYQWNTYGNVLSPGSHTLKWTMNDSSSSYARYAYIDNLQISTTN